jgi:hypothetical protein
MRKVLLGAAAAMAIVAPGVASADTSGNVAFSYNSLDDDNDGSKEDYLALSGAVVTNLSGNWNLQFDAEMGDMNHSDHTDTFATATAQAFWRDDMWAFGGFAGFTSDETNGYILGADASVYLDRFSLSGTAFFGGDREDSDDEITGAGVSGSFFLSDNFSLGADVSWYEFDFGGGNDQDGTVYGVNAEYQFAGSAWSIFGGYHTSDEDYFGTDKEVDSFSIGGRYNFGTGSLIERDRSGASMLGASQLPREQIFGW